MASATIPDLGDQQQTVATLRLDEDVDAVFACTRKERKLSRAGSPYLTVELRDSTGAIIARAFRDADVLAGRFERGELVRVRGRVQRFRDALQIELSAIARADGDESDPARFLPTAYRDRDELEGFLEHLAREVYDPRLKALLDGLIGDQALRAEIRRAPCSLPGPPHDVTSGGGGAGSRTGRAPSGHHAYLGGLLEHTVAVATLALELCTLHPRLDRDLLLTAAIVHDLGKTREFTYGAEIERSREGAMLGHIELGLRVIAEHMPAVLNGDRRLALEHCVLLHHGPESASGQRFASPEALALYRVNLLDAQVKGVLEHGGLSSDLGR
ncbi:MAG TPA: HD domain-containing protein [Solirubrobacteraceae bacterium]|jgi:3'-5' exoribonuclease|nr:HD domain-containing protein [Solirubrobacteraceae bacterium]